MNIEKNQKINVGVDTGKFQLDIYIRPLDIYFTVQNDEKGIKEAVRHKKTQSRAYCYWSNGTSWNAIHFGFKVAENAD